MNSPTSTSSSTGTPIPETHPAPSSSSKRDEPATPSIPNGEVTTSILKPSPEQGDWEDGEIDDESKASSTLALIGQSTSPPKLDVSTCKLSSLAAIAEQLFQLQALEQHLQETENPLSAANSSQLSSLETSRVAAPFFSSVPSHKLHSEEVSLPPQSGYQDTGIITGYTTLSQEDLDRAKSLILDLLGWGVAPEYLITSGVSSQMIHRVFTDLRLRLPSNLVVAP